MCRHHHPIQDNDDDDDGDDVVDDDDNDYDEDYGEYDADYIRQCFISFWTGPDEGAPFFETFEAEQTVEEEVFPRLNQPLPHEPVNCWDSSRICTVPGILFEEWPPSTGLI